MDDGKPSGLSPEVENSARQELRARLKDMATALEQGDDLLFAERLQELLRRREDAFFQRIAQLTHELQAAVAELDSDARWNALAGELPDAGARIDHVIQLTENAAHRTLDLVEEGATAGARRAQPGAREAGCRPAERRWR